MNRLIFILLFSIPFSLKSQATDSLETKKLILTTSVLKYLPVNSLNTGNFNMGASYYLGNNKSVYLNLGYIKSYGPSGGKFEINAIESEGMSLQLEGRHFFNKHKLIEPLILIFWPHIFQYNGQRTTNAGYYFGIRSFGKRIHTNRSAGIVRTNALGLNIKFGYQCIKESGFTIDHAVGVGGQYISSHSDFTGEDFVTQHTFPWGRPFENGKGFYPSLLYEVNIGWSF